MAALTPTYAYYRQWGGTLDEDTFNGNLHKAAARVSARCCLCRSIDSTNSEVAAYMNAICAAVETMGDAFAGVSSYSAGKVSQTFSADAAAKNTIDAAIERELSGTRLIGTGLR